jgi:hypothetical protein
MLRTIALAAIAVAMAACTVRSFDSNRAASTSLEKVQTAHVAFIDQQTGKNTGRVAIGGLLDLAASTYTQRNADDTKVKNRALFDQAFMDGFKDKFPATAANYGLTVSDTAPTELRITVGDQTTICGLAGCVSNFAMTGDLLDAAGKSLWHFETELGQSTIFAKIPELYDRFAVEVLNAMKKDGVIGS